jgi:hypothetical protein
MNFNVNKMKNVIVLWCMLVLSGTAFAQRGDGPKREKIESLKVGYITQKINLTSEEAQRFWPVYNKYSDEMERGRRNFRGKMVEELKGIDNLTDAEADKAISDMIAYKSSEVELLKKYTIEFKKVIPSQKVVKLFVAEQEFKRELLKKLKEQRER